ncbi:CatA-like O-acetyltransferase [Methanosarcina mazei]|uniref:Chloramphenicol acetyltransferase n=3 Tax=Methanosarcina mazei TaxID=2209 RepID=A0A0F8J2N6_METMZ|nr:CatA-like O-acetyltransferase [Methanosarcina mazei]AKB41223.1 Chloramphenicol acetyltransferase [Methanosarcina mazei WWM610]KKG69933.1 chloramphenicol acetyltransferase [Methanosarcina mazei]KKH62360.1 chloramphenicol acetyltransferase [Methanosarcina mazei]
MENRYQIIDFETWKRREYCQIYRNAVQPQYCVSFELDVTNFKKYVKENNLSFTMAFIFAVTKCANEIEEFRYRFLDGEVVLYESIDTSFTYLDKETELFKVVNVPIQNTIEKFVQLATATAENQKEHFTGPVGNDVYQFSALPWITFTHISHTDFGNREKAQPIFDWGRYHEREGRLIMPFVVQVLHAFVDGIHIGKLADRLQKYMDKV